MLAEIPVLVGKPYVESSRNVSSLEFITAVGMGWRASYSFYYMLLASPKFYNVPFCAPQPSFIFLFSNIFNTSDIQK